MAASDHGTLTYTVTSLTIEADGKEGTLTETRSCKFENKDTYTPDLGSAHGDYGQYFLRSVKQDTVRGGLCRIVLEYKSLAPFASGDGLPDTQYSESVSTIEVDIRLHPDFASFEGWNEEDGEFDAGSPFYGVKSFLRPSAVVTKTTFHSTEPNSKYSDVGKLEVPGGGYSGSNNWLVMGSQKQFFGEYWVQSTTYMFSPVGWSEDIYEDA